MEAVNISLTDLGRIARYNGYNKPGHNALEFAKALSKSIAVNVEYYDGRILVFRNGEFVETIIKG